MKLTKIYGDACDKYVANVVLYAKTTSDGYLYTDSAATTTVDRATLLDLCMKGLVLVSHDGSFYKPLFFKDSGTEVSLTVATAISASASAAMTLKSKEPEEEE